MLVGFQRVCNRRGSFRAQACIGDAEYSQLLRIFQEVLELVDTDGTKRIVSEVKLLNRLLGDGIDQELERGWKGCLIARDEHIAEIGVPELIARVICDQLGDILARCRVV